MNILYNIITQGCFNEVFERLRFSSYTSFHRQSLAKLRNENIQRKNESLQHRNIRVVVTSLSIFLNYGNNNFKLKNTNSRIIGIISLLL